MELEKTVLERVESWDSLSRWEKSELGRDLRRLGLSYGEIMELVPVEKSTLATWCRDIALTDQQITAIKERDAPLPGIPRDTQHKRRQEIQLIRTQALLEAQHLIMEPLWLAGTVLYWGEEFKTENQLGMANADPHALRLFISWADTYHLPSTGFRARINLHASNDESAARRWWSVQLGIPLSNFNKSYVKPDGTGHRKNHLEHGVCLVTKRKCADAFHATMAWIEFIQTELGH